MTSLTKAVKSTTIASSTTVRPPVYNDAEALRLQQGLSDAWSPAMFDEYLSKMGKYCDPERCKGHAYQPVIIPPSMRDEAFAAAQNIVTTLEKQNIPVLCADAVPGMYQTREPPKRLPGAICIDFAVTAEGLKLIEFEGTGNYYGFAQAAAEAWISILANIPGMPQEWSFLHGDKSIAEFQDLTRRCMFGTHTPQECAITDIGLATQKTGFDFQATHQIYDIPLVDLEALTQKGDTLLRPNPDGKGEPIPVRRVYYRPLADEIRQKEPTLHYDLKTLSTEWFPNPGDQLLWSKGTMVHLHGHPNVPQTIILSEASEAMLAGDLSKYVLKRLGGYGGTSVVLKVTPEDIESIPVAERNSWCLQEKIVYDTWLMTCSKDKKRKVGTELRVIMVRDPADETRMIPTYIMPRCYGKNTGIRPTIALWPRMAQSLPTMKRL